MPQVFELFPTPLMRVERVIDAPGVAALRARFGAAADTSNQRSDELSHSRMLAPGDDPLLGDLAGRLAPSLVEFGELLFGEKLRWRVKEMWVNVMQNGGRQSVHNHANCFISGVLYLSECDASANTVFVRGLGGRDYVFDNTHAGTTPGPFNAAKWTGPAPAPGDLLLFPSYLLHEVPVNRGGLRVTLSFNAVPHRLDAWGYALSFCA
jgi:uncharacterized protein (TIGR02466 family)